VQWEQGAVGNAKWTGVSLAALLDRAQIKKDAVDVVFVGADSGETKDGLKTSFVRSVPLKKALRSNTILAYAMNDSDLPRSHGFPLRAVVPGWYGVASVKWLTRVFVTDRVFRSYFQSLDYTIWRRDGGLANLAPITTMLVKSIIAAPTAGSRLGLGNDVVVSGAAWTGDGEIAKVEVSVDEGRTWNLAKLKGESIRDAWRLWQFNWRTPTSPGKLTLCCRATDSAGNVQPQDRDDDRRNYLINHIVPVPVEVG
jgi:DMSO/TMAO reductase YedYZ molybdopterin-dependent catalytic subunit